MDYNNTRKSQPSPGLWSLIDTGRVSGDGDVCGCRGREGCHRPHRSSVVPQSFTQEGLSLSRSCATTAIFISVVPQYQAPVPGVRGQHHDTSMISLLFLLSICTCIPGPSNSRGGQGNGNKIIVYDIPVSVNTNMSTSLPTIYPSYLYLNSQENKVNAKRDIMRNLFYSHDIFPFLWCDVILFCHLTTRPNTMQHFCNGLSN